MSGLFVFDHLEGVNTLDVVKKYVSDISKISSFTIRRGVIIKKRKHFGLFPKKGGGVEKQQISLKFKFGLLKTDGGVGIFQKSLNFKFGDHMGL